MRSTVRMPLLLIVALLIIGLVPLTVGAAGGYNPNNPNQGVVWFSPAYGPPGTEVTITGTGWRKQRGEPVTVTVGETASFSAAAGTTVRTDGTFALDPVTAGGGFAASSSGSSYILFTVSVGSATVTYWWLVTG